MSFATHYLRSAIGNHVLGGPTYTQPSDVYLALFTQDIDENGATTDEVTGGSYARQVVSFTEDAVVDGLFDNTSVSFTGMPETTVRAIALMDAATGGNMLYGANFSPVSVAASETYPVNGGTFRIRHA
jgi:hypothetical protein